MTLVAGVDSSTQSCKVVIRDLSSGVIVRVGRATHPVGTEVDPERWWTALHSAIADAGGIADVAAISIGGQQHGMVVLDIAGRVIRPALLWNDTRSAAAAAALIEEVGASTLAARTGSVPVASFTITKLRWLADAEPQNAAKVAAIALPHDWLTWRLRGFGPGNPVLTELVTDRSDASGTGYFNPSMNAYDRDLLSIALRRDAGDILLPTVLRPEESRTAGVLVIGPGAGDNAAAALGLDARTGDVIVSIGTSGTVFAVSATPSSDETGAVAGFADAADGFLPLVATLNAARVLDSIAGLLGVDYTGLGQLALEAEPGSGSLVLLPYFEGERTPNLPDATASLLGMTRASTTRPNLARAAIEGMLCGLADGLDALRAQQLATERILLIGGGAQNGAVVTIASQVFDLPVLVPEIAEYVAAGASAQSARALTGEWPHWTVAIASSLESDFHPNIRARYALARG